MRIRSLLALVLASALVLGACSDDDPPEWLVDRATPTTTTTVTTTTVPSTTTPEPGRALAVIDLTPGVCIEDASAFTGQEVNEITETRAVPCGLPHQAEAYARTELPAGPDAGFPGVGRLRTVAQETCRDRFERVRRRALDLVGARDRRPLAVAGVLGRRRPAGGVRRVPPGR